MALRIAKAAGVLIKNTRRRVGPVTATAMELSARDGEFAA